MLALFSLWVRDLWVKRCWSSSAQMSWLIFPHVTGSGGGGPPLFYARVDKQTYAEVWGFFVVRVKLKET